jgi:hypothetical protein
MGFLLLLLFESGSPSVAQDGLELIILLPLPTECWIYRQVALGTDYTGILLK